MLAVSNYHYIRENFATPFPSIFGLTPKQFKKQLEELSKHGTFISQNELLKFKYEPFDKNYILITFDDGLAEQFQSARSILNGMGIPYICFINTENFTEKKVSLVHKIHLVRSQLSSEIILQNIQSDFSVKLSKEEQEKAKVNYKYDENSVAFLKYLLNFKLSFSEQEGIINVLFNQLYDEKEIVEKLYLNDEMLQVMYKEGVLGSHSHSHIPLGNYDQKDINAEFYKTQKFFIDTFGKKSKSISYPYGSKEACNSVDKIAKEHDFELGFSMERAVTTTLNENPLMISRYDCNDMPLGKSNIFAKTDNLFKKASTAKWYR